ncbi:MAG: spike base protein, RCAP_Rcc01079 family [Beijerinckiaceae bacterium]
MPDSYNSMSPSLTSPLIGGFLIVPDDGNDLPEVTRQVRVTGGAGNVAVIWASGLETIEPVNAGDVLDWRLRRIKATGTTATGVRGYF